MKTLFRTVTLSLALTTAFTGHALAQDEQRLSAEVLWELSRVGAPVISPDGQTVIVFVCFDT